MKHSSWCNRMYCEVKLLLPEIELVNRSITTTSIYCRTPDGRSLRIGDHKGKEKYSYKWNLSPKAPLIGIWKKEFNRISKRNYWRFYTSSPERLVESIKEQKEEFNSN